MMEFDNDEGHDDKKNDAVKYDDNDNDNDD